MSGLFNDFFNSAKQKQNQFLKKKLLKKDESADSGAEDATEPEKAPKSKDVKSAPKKNEQVSEDKKQTKKRKAVDDAVAEQPQHQDSDHEETPSKKAKQMPKGKKNLDEMLEFSDEDSVMEFGSDDEDESLKNDIARLVQTGGLDEDSDEAGGDGEAGEEEDDEEEFIDHSKLKQKTIFVGNLPPTITQNQVKTHFDKIAKTESVRLMPPKREGSSSGIAFVEFKTHTGAQKAIDTDGAIILGRKMQISWAKDRAEATANANTFSVFVKNVSFETSSDTLRSIFEDCGDIVSIRMPTFPDTGKPRGYAFVDFKEQSSVKNALKLNRVEVDRRQLLVEAAGSANGSPSN